MHSNIARVTGFEVDGSRYDAYRLPDGRVVMCDASAVKGARWIQYQLADGRMVIADRVDAEMR